MSRPKPRRERHARPRLEALESLCLPGEALLGALAAGCIAGEAASLEESFTPPHR